MKSLHLGIALFFICGVFGVLTIISSNERVEKISMEDSIDFSASTSLGHAMELGNYRLYDTYKVNKQKVIEVFVIEFAKKFSLSQDVEIRYFIQEQPALMTLYADYNGNTYSETYIIERQDNNE